MPAWLLFTLQKSLTAADESPIAADRPPWEIHSPEAVVPFKNTKIRKRVKPIFMLLFFSTNLQKN
jgi:hypothetical protein